MLHLAAEEERPSVIAALLAGGADPDAKDKQGSAALHIVVKKRRERTKDIEALLAGGADPCVRDRKRNIPIYYSREGSGANRLLYSAGGIDWDCDEKAVAEAPKQHTGKKEGGGTTPSVPVSEQQRETAARVETAKAKAPAKVVFEPKCADLSASPDVGEPCWMRFANKATCHFVNYGWNWDTNAALFNISLWDGYVNDGPYWSGNCQGGLPVGHGIISWKTISPEDKRIARDGFTVDVVMKGRIVDGKPHGKWALKNTYRTKKFVTESHEEVMMNNAVLHGPRTRTTRTTGQDTWCLRFETKYSNGERLEHSDKSTNC